MWSARFNIASPRAHRGEWLQMGLGVDASGSCRASICGLAKNMQKRALFHLILHLLSITMVGKKKTSTSSPSSLGFTRCSSSTKKCVAFLHSAPHRSSGRAITMTSSSKTLCKWFRAPHELRSSMRTLQRALVPWRCTLARHPLRYQSSQGGTQQNLCIFAPCRMS